jgi:uncharacterized protein (DUF2062 family)/trans-aconitate methyltransferase
VSGAGPRPELPSGLRRRLHALWARLRGGELSRFRACASVAAGLFIGCLPLYGLHFVLCLAICVPLRLDLIVAYLAANVSNPLIAPFLVTLEVEVGSLLLAGRTVSFDVERARQIGVFGFFGQAALGSVVVGTALASIGAFVTSLLVSDKAAHSALAEARRRTRAHYRHVPPADRMYVSIKLQTDPVAAQLASLEIRRGHVLDAGCGRGQFGVLLLELGYAESVLGFDWDPRKVKVAAAAAAVCDEPPTGANGSGESRAARTRFVVGDLHAPPEGFADIVLLIDVLHYLTLAEQDALIAELAKRLRPGGCMLIRDLDQRSSAPSRFTQLLERLATRSGYNRAASLHFRPMRELSSKLELLGFECEVVRKDVAGPLGNVLLMAQKPMSATDSQPPSLNSTEILA